MPRAGHKGGEEATYTTDERGVFVIPLRPGQYDVYVSNPGFQTHKYPSRIPDDTKVVLQTGLRAKERP